MDGIQITSKDRFDKAISYLERLRMFKFDGILNEYGQKGVDALRAASPRETGELANSWTYSIVRTGDVAKIEWHNTDVEGGYSVALLIQYGHGTNNGGYVPPHDYINPAIEPILNELALKIGAEVRQI
jgi:hypothetical protein